MAATAPQWSGRQGPLVKEELREFLHMAWVARLATLREDGAPYCTPVWYEYDGTAFYIVARERSAYVRHIRMDPRVCLSIARDDPPYARVQVEGEAEIVEGPAVEGRWVEIARRMIPKYYREAGPEYLTRTLGRPRVLIRIAPKKITSWGGGDWHPRYL